jgi:hypothetical protein
MMASNFLKDGLLNVLRNTAFSGFSPFVGLLTAISNLRTPAGTEANYTGYGTRPAIGFAAPGDTSPAGGREIANAGEIAFPQNTGSLQAMIGWGVYDASTAGNLRQVAFLDADPPVVGTALASSEVITAPAHGLANDQRVLVMAAPGALLPAGLSENTAYFVVGVTTNTFQLSATQGGAAVNITADGAGMFIPYTPVDVAAQATPKFAAGTLKLQF